MLPVAAAAAELKPATEQAYTQYVGEVERGIQSRGSFLRVDTMPEIREKVRQGELWAQPVRARRNIPDGSVHHWEGTVFIPGATVNGVIKLVQNYDQHARFYAPEVATSKLLRRNGNEFDVRMRVRKKVIVSVAYETDHKIRYRQINPREWESSSHSTRVSEVANLDSSNEQLLQPGTGNGYLWRIDSFWRFQEADGGVYVECVTLSLSRDVPFGMGRILRPILEDFPKESLKSVLKQTRSAYAQQLSASR
jgi:hypothetical protein